MDNFFGFIKDVCGSKIADGFYAFPGFFLGIFSTLIFLWFTNGLYKEYAYVDVESVISEIHKNLNNTNYSDAELEIKINQAKTRFKKEIDSYAKNNNILVISSPKIIAGSKDITNLIKVRVLESLK